MVHPPSWTSCRGTAEVPLRALRRAQPNHCPMFTSVQLSQLTSSSEQGSCGVCDDEPRLSISDLSWHQT